MVRERRCVLSVTQLIESVFQDVPESFSLFEMVGDAQRLVTAALDTYFYGMSMDGVGVEDLLASYGMPTDVRQKLVQSLENRIAETTLLGFQRIYPARLYAYRLLSERHAVITEVEQYAPGR